MDIQATHQAGARFVRAGALLCFILAGGLLVLSLDKPVGPLRAELPGSTLTR